MKTTLSLSLVHVVVEREKLKTFQQPINSFVGLRTPLSVSSLLRIFRIFWDLSIYQRYKATSATKYRSIRLGLCASHIFLCIESQ